MHFELLPLLDHARSEQRPPLIMASIRDILQEGNKVSKDRQTVELVERYFDAVLVHGDPNLIPLDATFPFAPDISARIVYTGIVTPRIEAGGLAAAPTYDVVVSAGGGMLGRELIASALQARGALDGIAVDLPVNGHNPERIELLGQIANKILR